MVPCLYDVVYGRYSAEEVAGGVGQGHHLYCQLQHFTLETNFGNQICNKRRRKNTFLVKKIYVFIFFSYAIIFIFFVGGTFSFNKAVNFRKSDKDFLLELLRKAANNRYLTYC